MSRKAIENKSMSSTMTSRRIKRKLLVRLRWRQCCLLALGVVICMQSPVTGDYFCNEPPTAEDDYEQTTYVDNFLIDVLYNDSSVDGELDPSSVTIVTEPQLGTVSIDPATGEVLYAPDGDDSGLDYFEYTVKDSMGQTSNIASVEVGVTNDPPDAGDDYEETSYLDDILIDVLYNDYDEEGELDPSSVTLVTQPQFGTVTVNPVTGEILYSPDGDFSGLDNFTYTVKDSLGAVSNVANVDVGVINEPPVIEDFLPTPGAAFVWTISGTVTDEFPAGATVSLTGSLTASNIPVNADGSFSYSAYFDGGTGYVEAVATDKLGAESDTVSTFLDNI